MGIGAKSGVRRRCIQTPPHTTCVSMAVPYVCTWSYATSKPFNNPFLHDQMEHTFAEPSHANTAWQGTFHARHNSLPTKGKRGGPHTCLSCSEACGQVLVFYSMWCYVWDTISNDAKPQKLRTSMIYTFVLLIRVMVHVYAVILSPTPHYIQFTNQRASGLPTQQRVAEL